MLDRLSARAHDCDVVTDVDEPDDDSLPLEDSEPLELSLAEDDEEPSLLLALVPVDVEVSLASSVEAVLAFELADSAGSWPDASCT